MKKHRSKDRKKSNWYYLVPCRLCLRLHRYTSTCVHSGENWLPVVDSSTVVELRLCRPPTSAGGALQLFRADLSGRERRRRHGPGHRPTDMETVPRIFHRRRLKFDYFRDLLARWCSRNVIYCVSIFMTQACEGICLFCLSHSSITAGVIHCAESTRALRMIFDV